MHLEDAGASCHTGKLSKELHLDKILSQKAALTLHVRFKHVDTRISFYFSPEVTNIIKKNNSAKHDNRYTCRYYLFIN